MTISREQIRQLAEFHDTKSCALSFYYQPAAPSNKAHKEVAIQIKDLFREAERRLENRQSKSKALQNQAAQNQGGQNQALQNQALQNKETRESARLDLERIVRLAGEFRSNGTHAKAIFACADQNVWLEYDLPPQLPGTQLFVDRHFHLKPLASLLGAFPRLGIALVDRHRARFFDLRLGELTERESLFQPLSRKGRSDGFAGYDGGHAQRRVDDEARQHFKAVAAFLKEALETGLCEKWILGCQDAHRSLLEQQLHPYVSKALLGHFHADLGHVALDEIRAHGERLLAEWQDRRRCDLVGQALSEARGNARGVTGLRRVLHSLELGAVQTLLLGENFVAHAVECSGCGHLDAHLVSECPACGKATHEVVDVGEAILPWVIRRDIELFYVKDDPQFDKVGNIAALLRFRSEAEPNVWPITNAANQSPGRQAGLVGRYRGLAGG
jgi:peptide subunit release factor 1 (eRF1)